jgi:hypothetical protein
MVNKLWIKVAASAAIVCGLAEIATIGHYVPAQIGTWVSDGGLAGLVIGLGLSIVLADG